MAFQEVISLDCDNAIQLGGTDKRTRKANPTQVEGFYLGFRELESTKSKTGKCKLHVFQTDNGSVGVWGKTDLDRKLASATIGAMTRVTFTGMKETKNNPMYVYKVEVDKDTTIDVGALEASSGDSFAEEGADDFQEDTDPAEEAPLPDEAPPVRATAPRQTAQAPSQARQQKVKDLLARRG